MMLRRLRLAVPLLAVMSLAPPALADDIPETLVTDTSGNLPEGLAWKDVAGKDEGLVERVLTWNEGDGKHIAVFASSSKVGQKDDTRYETRGLYVTTFAMKGGKPKKVQQIKEIVPVCNLDITARFIEGSISLTNLDGDDQGELTFAYATRCAGDVSPLSLKVLVLEGKDKHALRGESLLKVGDETWGGTFRSDFEKGAEALLEHAKRTWYANQEVSY